MALQSTITNMKDLLGQISQDLHKAETGNKAASQRVRTMTVRLEKVAKHYRKESITSEKSTKGGRKVMAKKAAKPAVKKVSKPMAKMKSKPKAAMARPRALSLKQPTAKLPVRRPY